MRTTRGTGVVVGALLILFGSGCSETTQPADISSSATTSVTSEPSASASTTEPAESEEDAVIAAYKSFFEVLLELGAAEDSEQVRQMLAPYGTGVAVERLVNAVSALREANQEPSGEVVFSEITIEMDGAQASATECRDASTETIVDAMTKEEVSAGLPGSLITADLELDPSVGWRVVDYNAVAGAC